MLFTNGDIDHVKLRKYHFLRRLLSLQCPISSLCMLEDGTLLSGAGNEIKAWDTNSNFRAVKARQVKFLPLFNVKCFVLMCEVHWSLMGLNDYVVVLKVFTRHHL